MTLYICQALLTQAWTTKSYVLVTVAETPDVALARLRADAMASCGDGWRIDAAEVFPVSPGDDILIVGGLGFLIGHSIYFTGYRRGQIEAMEGRYHYLRIVAPDGSVRYQDIPDPTTRPVTVEAK